VGGLLGLFQKNTLSERDTVNIVATVAMVSLKRHYQGGYLLSASQRNNAATQLIETVLGDCSHWHTSKLMAFADTLIKAIINQPALDAYYSRELLWGKLAEQDAKKELSLLAFTGLLQNGLIAGHTASEWRGSTRVSKIAAELDRGMGDDEAEYNAPDYEIRNLTDLVEAGRKVYKKRLESDIK